MIFSIVILTFCSIPSSICLINPCFSVCGRAFGCCLPCPCVSWSLWPGGTCVVSARQFCWILHLHRTQRLPGAVLLVLSSCGVPTIIKKNIYGSEKHCHENALFWHCMSHWAGQCEWSACNTCLLQMGIVMYSEDPKVRFLLNRHSNSETLLQDILTTPFNDRPGNNIGVFMFFVFSFLFLCLCTIICPGHDSK